MRKVVDSNYLQSPKLRAYLSESRKNIAVVTDYAAMEAFKGNTLVSIFQIDGNFERVSQAGVGPEKHRQPQYLEGPPLRHDAAHDRQGPHERLHREWLVGLERAKAGDKDLQRQLLEPERMPTRIWTVCGPTQ